jgi:hypothetical protein
MEAMIRTLNHEKVASFYHHCIVNMGGRLH